MTEFHFEQEWRSAEPLSDFARRVVSAHELEMRKGLPAMGRPQKRVTPLIVLGLAALLISGAAAASLGPWWQPRLDDTTQESAPIEKAERPAPRLLLVSPAAPMEREKAKESSRERPKAPRAEPQDPDPEAPARPGPIHYPACHCSSGAVVCSCVD